MPWKECRIVEERLRFIARLLDGEKMVGLCREFGISRKTGYKIYDRYQDCGLDGLTDRSRRPYRHANQLPMQIEKLIVQLKREYPRWGAPKIRERLRRRYPAVTCPAISTVHAVLDRHGLVTRRKRRRYRAEGTPLSRPATPNALWCADYKGEFMLTDRRYCYPLTITDFASRYLITCDAFVECYNHERPHQALGMKVPGELYSRSPRPYQGLGDLDYPFHDATATVTRCGRICYNRKKINLSIVFAGQNVGVTQVREHIWLVSFMHYDLGYFDDETCRLEPIENPFSPKVLPMSPE